MSRLTYGSGKFVESVSEYSDTKGLSENKVVPPLKSSVDTGLNTGDKTYGEKDMLKKDNDTGEDTDKVLIPEIPANPDTRPKIIRYAEEYFGKYWFVVLLLILYLLLRKK